MNVYFCRATYTSVIPVPFWNIADIKEAVASDLVMADSAEAACLAFFDAHRGNLCLDSIDVEFRAPIDPHEVVTSEVKAVGDMALFVYLERVRSNELFAA